MKKTRSITRIFLLLTALLLLAGCADRIAVPHTVTEAPVFPDHTSQPYEGPLPVSGGLNQPLTNRHHYQMSLELDEQNKLLTGHLKLHYQNPGNGILRQIPLHLYANAFAKENPMAFFESEMRGAYPNGFSKGGIEIQNLKVDGADASYTIENPDQTLMVIDLPIQLGQSAGCVLEMDFIVTIPNCLGRFGYGEKTFNLCDFYPRAAAWNETDFYRYPYYAAGDPFVEDIADFDITLKVPQGMMVAQGGVVKKQSQQQGMDIYEIEAPIRRDFAAVVSRQFQLKEETVEGVLIKSYTYKGCDKAADNCAFQSAKEALRTFTSFFGPYPYPELSVVQTDFFIGGMEYPGIVLIDQSLYRGFGITVLEQVVVHEVGHQWWYAVVGNDQVMHPWLDEALTDYTTLRYYGFAYDEKNENQFYSTYVEGAFQYYRNALKLSDAQLRVGQPMTDFDSSIPYSVAIYTNGTRMFRALEQQVGTQKLTDALAAYYRAYAFRRVSPNEFINFLGEQLNMDARAFFDDWL